MNWQQISPIFCAFFVVAACAPRDVALVSDAERPTVSTLGKKSSNKNSDKDKNNSNSLLGNYSLAAQLVERQGEAIQAVMWVLNPEKQIKKDLRYQREGDGTAEVKVAILGQSMKSTYGSYNSQQSLSWQGQISYSDATEKKVLQKILIDGATSSLIGSTQADRDFQIQAQDFDKKMNVTVNSDNTLRVNYTLNTSLNIKKDKRQEGAQLSYNFDFDIVQTDEHEFQIKNRVARMVLEPGHREYSIQLKDNFKIKLDECVKYSGVVTVLGGKKTTELIFDEKNIRVSEGKWSSQIAECSVRPVIDFTRLVEQ